LRWRIFLVDLRKHHDLPVQVDHVLRLVGQSESFNVIALGDPVLVVALVEGQVEGLPALLAISKGLTSGSQPSASSPGITVRPL
jgi:hypothetical protein